MYPSRIQLESRQLEVERALRPHRGAAVAACAFVVALAAALLLTGPVAQARSTASGPTGASLTSPKRCTAEQGQLFIDTGRLKDAIREFTCVIAAQPTEVEGYRGRIEAELLLGRFSDAAGDHARITALVLPVHPDAHSTILAGYTARLAQTPEDIPALTGASFARWWFFDYASAIHLLNQLLAVRPDDVYGNLLRGSSRLLLGATKATYGQPDPERAFAEATLALDWGLDTPRVHAILASAYLAFGDLPAAASEFKKHIDLVTTELLPASPLGAGTSLFLGLVPGRTYEIPVPATAGQTISIDTSSHDFYDSILVLLAPDGSPVVGSDDYVKYFAGFQWVAEATGTYRLQVTSFEGVNTGELIVTRN